jgi:hypothetical protein
MKRLFFIYCLTLLTLSGFGQVSIMPDQPEILYTGRFSFADPLNPSFSMNGTSIKVNFFGTKISGRFSNSGVNTYLYVIIDGQADPYNRKVVELSGINESEYVLAENLSNTQHTLELVKLNESDSKVTFHGLLIDGAGLTTKPQRPPLQLEFIGDSNTAGWSAWDAYDNGGPNVSGAYFTFPGIVSRMLNAEYSLIGGSGSGVTNKASWNLTRVFERIHIADPETPVNTWNFEDNYWNFQPAAVVVNLGANDYYANTPKSLMKDSWKDFIQNKLRLCYPQAHIVLANSYGWAYNEPADYVDEAIEELKAAGETNVSFIRFPWLWGQSHAVINEHAGFANLLAAHLAEVLELEAPTPSELSSFVKNGDLYNGGFEKSILPGIADGCRPNGSVTLIEDASIALAGNNCLQLENTAWANFTTEISAGDSLVLTGWGKATQDAHSGYLRIEFKDQAQNTIKTQQIQPDFTEEWQEFTTAAVAPEGVWCAWIVMAAEDNSTVLFDNISLETNVATIDVPDTETEGIYLFPNPTYNVVNIYPPATYERVEVYAMNGTLVNAVRGNRPIDLSQWGAGLYFLRIPEKGFLGKVIKY